MFGNTAPATTLPEPSKRFALLIGVNEYRKLDKDGGLELFDLRAPRNDVIAWYKFLRRMDVPAENIRVLTTPMSTPQELDDDRAVCAEASTGAARQAVRWYFTTTKEHGNAGYGFVFLAGHGDFSMNQGH